MTKISVDRITNDGVVTQQVQGDSFNVAESGDLYIYRDMDLVSVVPKGCYVFVEKGAKDGQKAAVQSNTLLS